MTAKYRKVTDTVRERIENETYKVGEWLPDQNALAKEFKVKRQIVKKAHDILASEGLLYRVLKPRSEKTWRFVVAWDLCPKKRGDL